MTADGVYGSDWGLRQALEDVGPGYVVGVRTDHAALMQVAGRRWASGFAVPASASAAINARVHPPRLGCGVLLGQVS